MLLNGTGTDEDAGGEIAVGFCSLWSLVMPKNQGPVVAGRKWPADSIVILSPILLNLTNYLFLHAI